MKLKIIGWLQHCWSFTFSTFTLKSRSHCTTAGRVYSASIPSYRHTTRTQHQHIRSAVSALSQREALAWYSPSQARRGHTDLMHTCSLECCSNGRQSPARCARKISAPQPGWISWIQVSCSSSMYEKAKIRSNFTSQAVAFLLIKHY